MADRPDRTLFLETFGCQMNVLDSELVAGQFRRLGYRPADRPDDADLILFNTCSVRDHAEQKVNSRLGELRALKARRPDVVIGVIGCQAEREGQDLFARFGHVDVLCGPGQLHRLADLVAQVQADRSRAVALSGRERRGRRAPDDPDAIEALDAGRAFAHGAAPVQAYVRVQRGCDKFCAFCIVPHVRGAERSRPPAAVLAEVERLAAAGCREVTLIGQTVNSYLGCDSAGRKVPFARLLERVAAVAGLVRVRFVTSYPGDFDEDILRVMAEVENVCPYLHLPAQSGSDRILRAMGRQYTAADYDRLIERARAIVPGIQLAGDFIVGFPGETDADFAASVELVRRTRYKNCFIFKYSPRPGTAAARRLPDDVPEAVKRLRNNRLLAVQAEVAAEGNAALVGGTVRILVEGRSALAGSRPDQLAGRTAADQIVVFDRPPQTPEADLVGRLVDLRVEAVSPFTLIGRPLPGREGLAASDD